MTESAQETKRVTLHVLHTGLPLCRFTGDIPRDWPEGHVWLGISMITEEDSVTCPGCRSALVEHPDWLRIQNTRPS